MLRLIHCYNVSLTHTYADDIQICSSCLPVEVDLLSDHQMSASVEEVTSWVTSNRLQLNPSKSQVLWGLSMKLGYTEMGDSTTYVFNQPLL